MRSGMRGLAGGVSLTWLIVVAATLVGCGPSDSDGGAAEPPSSSVPPSSDTGADSPTPPATGAPPTASLPPSATPNPPSPTGLGTAMTLADAGKTVTMSVGDSRPLRLTRPWVWETPSVTGDAIQVAPVNYFVDPGFQEWAIHAVRPGEATLRVFGDAQCPRGTQCLVGDKVLELTIRVVGG